ncbi:MAG TPA: sulfite exporter TauE/SafE family protein [Terracidiphilus sp.]|nr:sulfite exporter TauE/SafE family protein [Terracidiphilus sp.]
MNIGITTLFVLLVLAAATLIRSTFGFGEAMFAVPLLALLIPLKVAAPLAVLLSITIAAVVVAQDWRMIHLRSTAWLVLSSLAGIPLGLSLLASGHQRLAKAGLAFVIMGCSVYFLIDRTPFHLQRDSRRWLLGCGFVAGILGGAYGMNGPPLVIYGSIRRWPAQQFRATLQAYFLPASILGMTGYWLAGLWVPAVSHYYLISLPVVLPAVFLGRFMHLRLPARAFVRYVYFVLGATGALLLIQAFRGRV